MIYDKIGDDIDDNERVAAPTTTTTTGRNLMADEEDSKGIADGDGYNW